MAITYNFRVDLPNNVETRLMLFSVAVLKAVSLKSTSPKHVVPTKRNNYAYYFSKSHAHAQATAPVLCSVNWSGSSADWLFEINSRAGELADPVLRQMCRPFYSRKLWSFRVVYVDMRERERPDGAVDKVRLYRACAVVALAATRALQALPTALQGCAASLDTLLI
ncbi:hypothetical protein J6590_032777 [Homalodisca vitripennis]|nr:hypothetical protein J6590_032777 [Homalodisca vitripennis]